jgi:hypothetical protein
MFPDIRGATAALTFRSDAAFCATEQPAMMHHRADQRGNPLRWQWQMLADKGSPTLFIRRQIFWVKTFVVLPQPRQPQTGRNTATCAFIIDDVSDHLDRRH